MPNVYTFGTITVVGCIQTFPKFQINNVCLCAHNAFVPKARTAGWSNPSVAKSFFSTLGFF